MIVFRRRSLAQSGHTVANEEGGLSNSTNTSATSNKHSSDMGTSNSFKKSKVARKVLNVFDPPRISLLNTGSCQKNSRGSLSSEMSCSPASPLDIVPTSNNAQPMQIDELEGMGSDQSNLMSWLQHDAPEDILPKILSLAGPQSIQMISRVSKAWNKICISESVFRSLCEDTGKWVCGKDPEPTGDHNDNSKLWLDYYSSNPIVPTDYASIPAAINAVTTPVQEDGGSSYSLCKKDVRILLRQGDYVLHDHVLIETVGKVTFSVETLCNSQGCSSNPNKLSIRSETQAYSEGGSSPRRRHLLSWRTNSLHQKNSDMIRSRIQEDIEYINRFRVPCSDRATIYLRTKTPNTPIFHIRQGTMRLSKLTLVHNSVGVDIWGGNTAVQVQPRLDHQDRVVPLTHQNISPRAFVGDSEIISFSGRGIVAIDGGLAFVRKCYIHECAATGIYIGGPGSCAKVEKTDIVRNGNGNLHSSRNSVTRGHSGVYLEQGTASLIDCNVSKNSLTGISAVSASNAFLILKNSDIVGNGTLQLEMPPENSISRRKSVIEDNNLSSTNRGRCRSDIVPDENMESSHS